MMSAPVSAPKEAMLHSGDGSHASEASAKGQATTVFFELSNCQEEVIAQ